MPNNGNGPYNIGLGHPSSGSNIGHPQVIDQQYQYQNQVQYQTQNLGHDQGQITGMRTLSPTEMDGRQQQPQYQPQQFYVQDPSQQYHQEQQVYQQQPYQQQWIQEQQQQYPQQQYQQQQMVQQAQQVWDQSWSATHQMTTSDPTPDSMSSRQTSGSADDLYTPLDQQQSFDSIHVVPAAPAPAPAHAQGYNNTNTVDQPRSSSQDQTRFQSQVEFTGQDVTTDQTGGGGDQTRVDDCGASLSIGDVFSDEDMKMLLAIYATNMNETDNANASNAPLNPNFIIDTNTNPNVNGNGHVTVRPIPQSQFQAQINAGYTLPGHNGNDFLPTLAYQGQGGVNQQADDGLVKEGYGYSRPPNMAQVNNLVLSQPRQ